jgi:hypothetical protein
MRMPDITLGEQTKSRYSRPFVLKNKADYEAAKALGCQHCGYVGPSLVMRAGEGMRRPAATLSCSRRSFVKALANCERVCLNCLDERKGIFHGFVTKRRKPRLFAQTKSFVVSDPIRHVSVPVAPPLSKLVSERNLSLSVRADRDAALSGLEAKSGREGEGFVVDPQIQPP